VWRGLTSADLPRELRAGCPRAPTKQQT
jgi:hypothetical protein